MGVDNLSIVLYLIVERHLGRGLLADWARTAGALEGEHDQRDS